MAIQSGVIKLQNVDYSVKSADQSLSIVTNINLEIKAGVTIAITGPSGSGKTSLLHLMAGLELPTAGHIYYDDKDITLLNEDQRAQLRSRRIGFIFQSFQKLFDISLQGVKTTSITYLFSVKTNYDMTNQSTLCLIRLQQ